MQKLRMIDCQTLSFSQELSKDRMERAFESFGTGVIQRLLCFALYLLGVNRSVVGRSLEIPPETVKSIVKALNRNGLSQMVADQLGDRLPGPEFRSRQLRWDLLCQLPLNAHNRGMPGLRARPVHRVYRAKRIPGIPNLRPPQAL